MLEQFVMEVAHAPNLDASWTEESVHISLFYARTVLLGKGVLIGCPQRCPYWMSPKSDCIPQNYSYQATTTYYYCSLTEAVCCCLQSCWDEHLSCGTSVYQFWQCQQIPQCRLRWRVRYRGDATRHSLLIVTKNRMGRRGENWHTNPALHQHHSPSHKGFILLTCNSYIMRHEIMIMHVLRSSEVSTF